MLREGRGRARHHQGRYRRADLRTGGEIRRLRLQQGPRRRLRAGRLSDGLSEGELSGRVPGRVDDARYRQHRPLSNVFRQEAARLAIEVARPTSTAVGAFAAMPSTVGGSTIYYALAAVKNVGRQAMDHVVAVREEGGPFVRSPISPAASIRASSTSALRKPRQSRRVRRARIQPRPRLCRRRRRSRRLPAQP